VTGQGFAKLISVEWTRFLSADLCLTSCRRKRASSRSSRIRGSGQPDRRHQLAVAQDRQHLRVDLVGLAGQRRQALHLLRVGDLDVPAFLLERVVDQAGTGHRLDHTANRLPVGLVDPPGQRPQRVHVRRRSELVDELPRPGQQTDVDLPPTEIQPSVQH
jgi:hypothetical protein